MATANSKYRLTHLVSISITELKSGGRASRVENSFAVRKKKLYEEVMEQISRLIESGNYNVGDRLPSLQELSEMFAVGKPTLREALSVLAAIGTLEIRHGSGIFIKRLPLKPHYEILSRLGEVDNEKLLYWLEFRRAVEVEAARLAAERRDENDIRAIEEAEGRMEEGIRQGKVASREDYLFHYRIAQATHNPIFTQISMTNEPMLQQYFELSLRQSLATPWRRELVIEEHREIIDSIKKGRPHEARRAMLEHITNVIRKVQLLEGMSGNKSNKEEGKVEDEKNT
ncbi:MAG: GntR family transcriptional regulator, transcriptional repressor for pyruvate dehydrogenase complex [Moorella sp. (in: firmicutes)]|nr:GntR family transcriptional regulator, transcriptional repressor for pyruvate dehydrogenase complex [Moorella sp. (in: firmicutes)]GEA17453.1 GntR family transcriptional regulator [Moorella sp. E306M]